jgi:hypothetical protein
MHASIQPARLTRSRRAPARRRTAAERGLGGRMHGKLRQPGQARAGRLRAVRRGFRLPAPPGLLLCTAPVPGRVWHPALAGQRDRRPRRNSDGPCPCPIPQRPAAPRRGSNQHPATTDIRQDLKAFGSMFQLPAARIQVVNTLAGSGSPWRATGEEVEDTEIVHAVAPAATLRVVLLPSNVLKSAATATADMLAGLRLAVSGTNVASISFSLGEHYFTTAQVAQMHSILLGAAAHHVTVVASSGDNGAASDDRFGDTPVKEVSLPASDPLVLAVGGTTLTASPSTGAYIGETAWEGENGFVVTSGGSGGGFSHLYARPAYQDRPPGISTMRGVPDVAGAAGQPGGDL